MIHALKAMLAPAVMERLTLVLNHVLAAEPVAGERLKAHAGRCIRLHLMQWPGLLPQPPLLAFGITAAGLLEWRGEQEPVAADLEVQVDASNPAWLMARLAAGEAPAIEVKGDAALATDVHWLIDNLRWDVEADLGRVVDPRIAHELVRAGSALMKGLRAALRGGIGLATRWRPSPP